MSLFERLRAMRTFERQHLEFFSTGEDYYLVAEIGYHQAKSQPLTLKQLFLLDIGSVATIQRRLRRLKALGLVRHRRAKSDRRSVELTLTPKCIQIFEKYDTPFASRSPVQPAGRDEVSEPRHVCGLCDSDAGSRTLVVAHLRQGLKRGDKCLLVAPAKVKTEILAELNGRRKVSEQLVISEGCTSADAQLALLKRVSEEATQAGQAMCFAADMSWTLSRNVRVDAVLDIETRLDALAGQAQLTALCVYDARDFSSGNFLSAVKCHHDHLRYPIMLG